MADIIEITQKASPVSNGTQIGVQYIGMTPEQASKQTIDLFMENFPKLQSLAKEIAEERAIELCNEILRKLEDKQINDFKPFIDPDVQYVFYEAQKNYARFGDKKIMDILTELVVNRILNDNKSNFKRVVDSAILVACELSSIQLDCLSALFLLTRVHFGNIKTIQDLNEFFQKTSSIFNLDRIVYSQEVPYLNFKGCLHLTLPNISKIHSQQYNLPQNEVDTIMNQSVKQFSGDYGISEIGILLAIINAERKSLYRFNPHIWIRD